jgi:hypothetical protein
MMSISSGKYESTPATRRRCSHLDELLAFGTTHAGLNPFVIIIDGLLFSTPYALLLIKKDFEYAVGYHFMTDFVRFTAAFLS